MSKGLLPSSVRDRIDSSLPLIAPIRDTIIGMPPDLFASRFDARDLTPVAVVCLSDWCDTMTYVRVALFEYHAHGTYYRDFAEPPRPMVGTFFERYFLDDAAVRLYSGAEHLASAIAFMRNLDDRLLDPYRKRRNSFAIAIAKYLAANESGSTIAGEVTALGRSRDWRFVVQYRNRWVHDQPPTIRGLGVVYRRRLLWKVSADGSKKRLDIGGGDDPEYDVERIAEHLRSANAELISLGQAVLEDYIRILEQRGIRKTETGWVIGH